MQKLFPALTGLNIRGSNVMPMAVVPQVFLGGSAQHLRLCNLVDVEFPGIWKLLLTTNHLVTLHLWDIPHSMYILPEGMATCLSTMPSLESLSIGFQSPESPHNWPDQPNQRLTCVVLPSLTDFQVQIISKYIKDFVSWINVPLLDMVNINFFDEPMFNIPQLHNFLARIEKFKAHCWGAVTFWGYAIEFQLELGFLSFAILCDMIAQQLLSMAQLCGSSLPLPSALKHLDIHKGLPVLGQQDTLGDPQWLDFLHLFTGLRDLHLGKRVAIHYAYALQELAWERVTEVLPALQNLFIEGLKSLEPAGPTQEALGKFVTA